MSRKKLLLIATLVAAGLTVPAGSPSCAGEALSLERAVAIALENSPALDVADAEVDAARARLDAARGTRLPEIALSETASRTDNPVMVFSNLLGQESFGPENFAIESLNRPDALNNFKTRLSLSQPLWTGGRIRRGIAAARSGAEAAREEAESARQHVVHGVIEAFTGAVLAQSALDVARESLETADAHVKMVRDMREAGLVVESDLLQARVRQSEVREMLASAEAGAAVALAGLNVAMGLDVATPHELPAALDPAALESAPLPELERQAREARPDLAALGRQLDAAREMTRVARAERWPQVGLGGAWEANDEDAPGTEGTNWSVMLSARWTVFDGQKTSARVAEAEARARRVESALRLRRAQVGLEVRRAWHGLRAASARVESASAAVSLAEESLRVVEDRYQNGLATLVELLDAESALTRSKTRLVAARRAALTARAALDLATGRL